MSKYPKLIVKEAVHVNFSDEPKLIKDILTAKVSSLLNRKRRYTWPSSKPVGQSRDAEVPEFMSPQASTSVEEAAGSSHDSEVHASMSSQEGSHTSDVDNGEPFFVEGGQLKPKSVAHPLGDGKVILCLSCKNNPILNHNTRTCSLCLQDLRTQEGLQRVIENILEEAGSVDRMDMFNNVISNLQDPVERFKEEEATEFDDDRDLESMLEEVLEEVPFDDKQLEVADDPQQSNNEEQDDDLRNEWKKKLDFEKIKWTELYRAILICDNPVSFWKIRILVTHLRKRKEFKWLPPYRLRYHRHFGTVTRHQKRIPCLPPHHKDQQKETQKGVLSAGRRNM